jgi:hypothetical protein
MGTTRGTLKRNFFKVAGAITGIGALVAEGKFAKDFTAAYLEAKDNIHGTSGITDTDDKMIITAGVMAVLIALSTLAHKYAGNKAQEAFTKAVGTTGAVTAVLGLVALLWGGSQTLGVKSDADDHLAIAGMIATAIGGITVGGAYLTLKDRYP